MTNSEHAGQRITAFCAMGVCFLLVTLGARAIPPVEFDPGGFSVLISARPLGMPGPEEAGVTIRSMPHAFMDDVFCLSQSQPALMLLAFENRREAKIGKLVAFVELPASVELVAVGGGKTVLGRTPCEFGGSAGVRYAIDATSTKGTIKALGYNIFSALALVLRTDVAPSDTLMSARYWLENDGVGTSPRAIALRVIPTIKGKRPQWFETGVHFTPNCADLPLGGAVEEYAKFYTDVGCNVAHCPPSSLAAELGRLNVVRYMQPSGWLVNGCMVGRGPRPDSVKFQLVDGTYHSNGTCPAVIYRKETYYRDKVEAPLRDVLVHDRMADHIMANWEPFMFDFKGCFCARCREDFIAYTKLPAEHVADLWPKQIIDVHRDSWLDFRSWQNARVVQTIEASVNAMGKEIKLDAHFAPEMHIKSITQLWRTSDSLRQYSTMAYADKIPLINAWGPYPWQTIGAPYRYVRGYNLSTHCLAKDAIDYIRDQIPEGRRPRLISFPHGLQGNTWTTEPESMVMDILSYFIHQWGGTIIYAFPKGYDARYWAALAGANDAIAEFEDVVSGGTAQRKHDLETVTPIPRPSPGFIRAPCGGIDAEKWQDADLIQCTEYRHGDKRLFAVANYWQRGECFFRLRITGVPLGARFVLREPLAGRCFAGADGNPVLTAWALRKGMLLHVGAQRFSFFMLEQARAGGEYGTLVPTRSVTAAMEARRGTIQAAYDAEPVARKPTDWAAELKGFKRVKGKGGSVNAVKDSRLGRLALRVQTARQTLVIDPFGGGRVSSWRVGDEELVHADKTSGLALDAFWYPAAMVTEPYAVAACTKTDDGIQLVLEKQLLGGGHMAGATIEKAFTVSRAVAGFSVVTTIRNTTGGEVEFSYRFHNMPGFLELRDGTSGTAQMVNAGNDQTYARTFTRHMYSMAGAEPDARLTKAFDMGTRSTISESTVSFSAPWCSFRVTAELTDAPLNAIVFWDSKSMPCPTFEPIFSPARLKKGDTWQATTHWRVAE